MKGRWWAFTVGGAYRRGPFSTWTKARRAAVAMEAAGNRVVCRQQRTVPGGLPWTPGAVDRSPPQAGLPRRVQARTVTAKDAWGNAIVVGGFGDVGPVRR